MTRSIALLAPVLLLAACGDKQTAAPTDDGKRNAEGDVLGGTISDAMLPLDTVTSRSPPLREKPEPVPSDPAGGSPDVQPAAQTADEPPAEASEP